MVSRVWAQATEREELPFISKERWAGACVRENRSSAWDINFSTCLLQIKMLSQAQDCVYFKSIWELQARDINVGIFSRQKVFKSMSLGEHECWQNKEGIWGLNPGEPNIWRSRRTTSTSKETKMELSLTIDVWGNQSVLSWKPREEIVSSKNKTGHVKSCDRAMRSWLRHDLCA